LNDLQKVLYVQYEDTQNIRLGSMYWLGLLWLLSSPY